MALKLFLLTALAGALSSCMVSDTMRAMECNRQAIEMSTQAICENVQAIEEANQSIQENRKQLDAINLELKHVSGG